MDTISDDRMGVTTVPDLDSALSSVSDTLWELRELLDICDYLLVVQRLVAESGHLRWIGVATQQLDTVCTQLRRTEVVRAGHVAELAELLHLDHDASLTELAAAAPEPWSQILSDHVVALRDLAATVAASRRDTEGSLQAGAAAVGAALDALARRQPGDRAATPATGDLAGRRLDRQA